MNRGEQIAREIIKMDKKHTWKYLSSSSFSSSSKKKGISLENLFFRKTHIPVAFFPSKGIPSQKTPFSEKLTLRSSPFSRSALQKMKTPRCQKISQPPFLSPAPYFLLNQFVTISTITSMHARLLRKPAPTFE